MNKKAYLVAGVAMLAMAACTSDDLIIDEGGKPANGTAAESGTVNAVYREQLADEGTLDLTTGEELPATRMTFNQGHQYWQVGDAIALYKESGDGTAMNKFCVSSVNTAANTCTFANNNTALFSDDTPVGTKYYAIYPYESMTGDRAKWSTASGGVSVSTMVYTEQDYTENMLGDPSAENAADKVNKFGNYIVGHGEVKAGEGSSKVLDLKFTTLLSTIDIDLSNLGDEGLPDGVYPRSVTIKSNNGECIAGVVTYDFGTTNASMSTTDATKYAQNTQSDIIKVANLPSDWVYDSYKNCSPEEKAANPRLVRFYLLPVRLAGGVTVTVELNNNSTISKQTTNPIGKLNDADEKGPEVGCEISGVENYKGGSVTSVGAYYKLLKFGKAQGAKQGDWMSGLPSDIYFSLLSIPGAHEAGTDNLTKENIRCQTQTIEKLLDGGCRALDLRIGADGEETDALGAILHLSHRGYLSGAPAFKTVLDEVCTWLGNHSTEAVVLRLHREDPADRNLTQKEQKFWSRNVKAVLDTKKDYLLEDLKSTTTLQECRGKIIVISCDEIDYSYGTELTSMFYGATANLYPNAASTISLNNKPNDIDDLVLTYQDIYKMGGAESTLGITCLENFKNILQRGGVYDYNSKLDIVKKVIDEATVSGGQSGRNNQRWFMNYCNWDGPSENVAAHARNLTPQVNKYIASRSGRLGILMADLLGDPATGGLEFIGRVVQQNFAYIFQGRSRIYKEPQADNSSSNTFTATLEEPADGSTNFVRPQGK